MTTNEPGGDRGRRAGGIMVGITVAVLLAVSTVFSGAAFTALTPVIAGVGLVAAIVLLTRPDPFQRALGTGLFVGAAIVLLLVGACFAVLAGLDV